MRTIRFQTFFTLTLIVALFCLMTLLWDQCGRGDGVNGAAGYSGQEQDGGGRMVQNHPKLLYDSKQKSYYYGPDMPLIFVGGFPRSGTTLMRAMLDAHPDIRCGEETRVIPRILGMRSQWKRNEREWKRLIEAGVNDRVIDSAITWFILEVIAKHGQPAKVFCNKDPFALKSTEYLSSLFPNSKYVLMIRDGRGTVHSMISRGVTVTGFDLKNPRQCLEKWNQAISQMYHQCYLVGEHRCFPMYYEQLVLHPEKWMKELTKFLQVPWNESVLHHELFIGDEISLSKTEKSTDQVVKPVNTEALTKWVGKFPEDVVKDMAQIAPMLSHLGYDPKANPPNYGKASDFVLKKTEDVVKNAKLWEERVANVYNGTLSKAPQPEAAVLPSDANQSSSNSTSDNNNISNSDNNKNDNNNNISVTKEE